ncbi:hypothetical protein ES703_98396 [subsurface metagenome]
MTLTDWLPLFPWEGPPLPRFLGIYWPRLQAESLLPVSRQRYVTDVEEEPPGGALVPSATYANKEKWKIKWSPEGLPIEIEVDRNATRT